MKNNLAQLRINSDKTIELSPGNFLTEPLEWKEQEALIAQSRAPDVKKTMPGLERLYCIPNGVPLVPRLRVKMQKMGLTSGVPDLHLPLARRGYNSLYIELKRLVSGSPSEAELEWITFLRREGHAAWVAHGRWEAWAILRWYYQCEVEEDICGAKDMRLGRTLLTQFPMNLDFSPAQVNITT